MFGPQPKKAVNQGNADQAITWYAWEDVRKDRTDGASACANGYAGRTLDRPVRREPNDNDDFQRSP
jgi:hypothetical protein